MDSGREQNYWPGFVDALSNVVLTLVFVLVIFVFALVMASNKVEQKMQQIVQAQQQNHVPQGDNASSQPPTPTEAKPQSTPDEAILRQQLTTANAQVASANAQIDKLQQQLKDASTKAEVAADAHNAVTQQANTQQTTIETKDMPTPKLGTVAVKNASNSIVLAYPISVTNMDDKSVVDLGHAVAAIEKTHGRGKIILRSIVGKESYSAARRLAYYRAIDARNALIKGGEPPGNISSVIVQPPQPEDGHVEVIFQNR